MDFQRLRRILRELGVVRLCFKELASNDNSKNQIYLAGDFAALHDIPHGKLEPTQTAHGTNLKAPVDFWWVDQDGASWAAPNAQLILYPQYPEVRLSGMLQGAKWAPNAVIASRSPGRVLVLGITSAGRIYAAAAENRSELRRSLAKEEAIGSVGVLTELRFERFATRQLLLNTLAQIAEKGWIKSKRLDRDGRVVACNAPNCGGLTLEAELGIKPNAISGPDFLGWEVKQHGVVALEKPASGVLTLMTPEPDGGDYKSLGVGAFIKRYGYEDRNGRKDRFNFGGIYKIGRPVALTGLRLEVEGFDTKDRTIKNADGRIVLLTSQDRIAASWSFATLLSIWTRKHAQAVFVPSVVRRDGIVEYRYGQRVHLGVGTDFVRLLSSVGAGCVYYDPGIKLEKVHGKEQVKRRSQFRVNFRDLHALYSSFQNVDATK